MLEAHKEIIKGREVVADDWSVLRLAEGDTPETVAVPEGKVIVPLSVWLAQQETLSARAELGVWIAADERFEALKGVSDRFAVIAVDFPKFSDGRGYSIAFNVRKRLGYTGELRAIGDVLRDQLFSMSRVGFNAYATRQDRSVHEALKGLTVFSETYQASVDQPLPLFRRKERDVQLEHTDLGAGI
ncbi:MAG: oxidoreductase [Massilia sp.]|nr:oxidoreductase [Massilia sp.]